MIAGEASGEKMPLSQQQQQPPQSQQQQQQHPHQQMPRKKRNDGDKTPTNESNPRHQLKPNVIDGPSRSSLSSVESIEVVHVRRPSNTSGRRRRRSPIKAVRHAVLVVSVILFASGLLATVIGFVNFDLTPAQRLPLQVAGPACLAATCVIVVLGIIFSRLWHKEMRRQRREIALKARNQLQSLASDLVVKRGSGSGRGERRQTLTAAAALQDPQLRRQLLQKLRQHEVTGTSSTNVSRRSSRAAAATRSRHSSITSALLRQGPRQSTDTAASFGGTSSAIRPASRLRYSNCDVPGIEISRIDTLDFDDGSLLATCSGTHGYGAGRKRSYVLLNSEGSSDFSRTSMQGGSSEYSLTASHSTRSRSSHDSSGSHVWDFSPRESDWDVQQGATSSSSSAPRGGAAATVGSQLDIGSSLLAPSMPRPGGPQLNSTGKESSTVTFDTSTSARRHSSPASSARRRNSVAALATANDNQYTVRSSADIKNCKELRESSGSYPISRFTVPGDDFRSTAAVAAFRRKSCNSGDQSLLSATIDEADTDEDAECMVHIATDQSSVPSTASVTAATK